MCDQTEISYLDGDVVWVKLGSCWWPGEVVGPDKLPPDVLPSFRKPPIAIVKFFQEDTYEYVKNINSIYKYNCSRKTEFINKGLYMYRTKHGHMEKFPDDVIRAETAIGGDIEILTRDEFQETKKESYAGLFGDTKKTPASKGKNGKGRISDSPRVTPIKKIKEKTDYKVHILLQGSKLSLNNETTTSDVPTTPSISLADQEPIKSNESILSPEEKPQFVEKSMTSTVTTFSTPIATSSGIYSCHACPFTTTRLNVLILHNKTHSVSFTPYTPSPIRKKPTISKSVKLSSDTPKTAKVNRTKKEKTERPNKRNKAKKRSAEGKEFDTEAKKTKTDEEIKSSLLADWDDEDDDGESNDETSMLTAGSPEIPISAESPAVPTPAELPEVQAPAELNALVEKMSASSPLIEDKPESSSDSKYEFCEDEDWPTEADAGRKIPRVKNPKRKEETKSLSIDEEDVAREVAELLTKTTLPELPTVPEPLKVEENFPEPSIVKSPDKNCETSPEKVKEKVISEIQPTKTIFKTKTFFRSRHSRSQDAIGKYVAEQLNAVERMDIADNDINGSEVVSSPEARESPPIEQVKVARLAPKIQLKKMKAEAAQLREKDKQGNEFTGDIMGSKQYTTPSKQLNIKETSKDNDVVKYDVLYPTQEIKPVNTEKSEKTTSFIYKQEENKVPELRVNDSIPEQTVNNLDYDPPVTDAASLFMTQGILLQSEKIPQDCELPMHDIVSDSIIQENVPEIIKQENVPEIKLQEGLTAAIQKSVTEIIAQNNIPEINIQDSASKIPVLENIPTPIKDSLPETIESDVKRNIIDKKDSADIDPDNIKPIINCPVQLQETKPTDVYINESTASAVDALLSVSRDTDRVPKIISKDLPDDLFEDDHKDNVTGNGINGYDVGMVAQYCEGSEMVQVNEESKRNDEIHDYENLQNKINEVVIPEEILADASSVSVTDAENVLEIQNSPSESDLQIAEALINLPSTAIQNKSNTSDVHEHLNVPVSQVSESFLEETVVTSENTVPIDDFDQTNESKETNIDMTLLSNNETINMRYETEHEKSENLNAAQSLVQMSESIDHKINVENSTLNSKDLSETNAFCSNQNNGIDNMATVEQKIALLSSENKCEPAIIQTPKFETSSPKLLKILEEPCTPKFPLNRAQPTKQIIVPGREKILNFDVAKSSFKGKPQSPKQKIIIRRTTPGKNVINNINDINSQEKIILSRTKNPVQEGTSVQTYTIQSAPEAPPTDANTIIIQQKIRKITKAPTKIQKIKPQNSLITPKTETKVISAPSTADDSLFDINSMPIVLSEDLLTPESIEKMPIVMSDDNIIGHSSNPRKLVKKHSVIEADKVAITASSSKPEVKTIKNQISEITKVTTPNILSKSSKLRGGKPMLVIDKTTGKQKIIMTKSELTERNQSKTVTVKPKEIKPAPPVIQPVPQPTPKTEKIIILPTSSSPRPGRTQKILIDPQTGKAHVLVAKGSDAAVSATETKPVSAKLIPSSTDANTPGNTVMIITNAQGAQSRIVLTPEHEKILFPNKQQPNVSQLKSITHRITSNNTPVQKTFINAPVKSQTITPIRAQAAPVKTPTRIIPKQKNAIITSKGQLIVGGRVATTAQNIAPMPEIRQVPKRIVASEPKKLVQTIQKSSSEPLIFLQQKSGAVMQLTAAQFEHLQRTGQIIQKTTAPVQENTIVVQKSITISPNESGVSTINKPRGRKHVIDTPTPAKKYKQEIAIAPAPPPVPMVSVPALAPLSHTIPTPAVPSASNTVSISTSSTYPDLENFEELLPSTAIVRHPEPAIVAPAPAAEPEPAAAPLADGQLLAVPGEHFGGPPGSFYLCVEDNGTLTPIDNRPLVLENNQLVPMVAEQPERRDILEAALANSDVFEPPPPAVQPPHARDDAPDFRDLNANVSVHCRVSETSTTLNQPIMTPLEMPTAASEPAAPPSLEDGLAVIGVTPHCVPTSLELPITVTDPRIAPRPCDPLSGPLPPAPAPEDAVGKSMPILTDEAPAPDAAWPRRLLAPAPALQLSVADLSHS